MRVKASALYLTPDQQARRDRVDMALGGEAARMDDLRARASIPDECGDMIPSAPGRGAFVMFTPREMVKTESGAIRSRQSGYCGRKAIRSADAFDVMQEQSARASRAKKRDGSAPMFTVAQITAGREYASLFERYQAAGAKCSSLEASSRSGPASGSFMDAVIRDGQRLERMRAAIGSGWALEPRRVGPHGDRRRAIPMVDVVHMVCIGGHTVTEILRSFGWAHGAKNSAPLVQALRDALDRMYDADKR